VSNLTSYLLLFASISLGVVGQLLLKHGMAKRPGFRLSELWLLARDFSIIGGFASYGISVLLYFKVLEVLDLSVAYPTVSLGYVLVILLSRLLFKEVVTPGRWAAVIIICAGVILVGLGA
jgi:multidrug transporter EmrE-like cation transporter